MKKLKSLNWTSIIIESLLIVFSILLALGINEYRNNNAKNQLRLDTLNMIKSELENNIAELDDLILNHKTKYEKLNILLSAPQDDEIKGKAAIQIIGSLDRTVLKRPSLSTTAWETAKITNGLNLLDYQVVQSLSSIYNMQENSVEEVWQILAKFLLSKEIFSADDVQINLEIFRVYLRELYKQEEQLQILIKKQAKRVVMDRKASLKTFTKSRIIFHSNLT